MNLLEPLLPAPTSPWESVHRTSAEWELRKSPGQPYSNQFWSVDAGDPRGHPTRRFPNRTGLLQSGWLV